MEKTRKVKKNISVLNMGVTLILYALIPMIVSIAVLSNVTSERMSNELRSSAQNAMVSLVQQTGSNFDYATSRNELTMTNFIQAPLIQKFLANPGDADLTAEAQQYTVDFYNTLPGWEGLYIADWNSKVLTHPAPPVVGKVMREGDRLEQLRNAMTGSGGVYNTGIISSPASGELIMSFYAPIYNAAGAPVGYVGGGELINEIAKEFSDVSSLGLSSAYMYYVDPTGTIVYHPDETLVGTVADNDIVSKITAQMAAGEHPAPAALEYTEGGVEKTGAYYVGANNAYVAALAADTSDIMASTNALSEYSKNLSIKLIILFAALAIAISFIISIPLKKVARGLEQLSKGDVTVECNPISHIRETNMVINAFHALKGALEDSMSNVQESAGKLNTVIHDVDSMTSKNADSISQINTAIDEVAKTSQSVAESAQVMSEKAVDLEQDVNVLNENVSSLLSTSQSIKEANDEATDCMAAMYAGSQESVQAVQDITNKITQTNDAIEKISAAIDAIETFASKTNLLSLNASIEAARAGAAGKGFSVVAEEIRTLADQSSHSATEIREIIENVMKRSNETVEIAGKVYEIISKEQTDIQATQEKFTVLSGSVEESLSGIDVIRQTTKRLDGIKENMMASTQSLSAISEELGASSQEVAASCQTVSTAIDKTKTSTEDMRGINDNMSSAIDFFKLA